MMYNVPQFIDVEDKIAGPLTWRQLGWIIGAFMVSFIIWSSVGGALAFVLIVPVILLAVALAFYQPNGQPMIGFLVNGFFFLIHPKVVVWDRPTGTSTFAKGPQRKPSLHEAPKVLSGEEISRIAGMVDRR